MCILFGFVSNEPQIDGYQVILANNRDEYYNRLTQPAHFWKDSPHCIGGIDLDENRGGGTWMGMSRKGKIGVLLNVLQNELPDRRKRSRGALVKDYLTSDVSGAEHNKKMHSQKDLYNKFNMLTIEKRLQKWNIDFFGTEDGDNLTINAGDTIAVSNCRLCHPWRKVVSGRTKFSNLVEQKNKISRRHDLLASILLLMKDKTPYVPDSRLESQALRLNETTIRERSAIYVDSPSLKGGTRTHTVILVDFNDNVTYLEQTLRQPVDMRNLKWDTTIKEFSIDPRVFEPLIYDIPPTGYNSHAPVLMAKL